MNNIVYYIFMEYITYNIIPGTVLHTNILTVTPNQISTMYTYKSA